MFAYLEKIKTISDQQPGLHPFFQTIQKTTLSYAPGLFHCYDLPGLPRTNNARESDFRDLNRRLLRTTGQKGLTRRIIQRSGAGNCSIVLLLCKIPSWHSTALRPRISAKSDNVFASIVIVSDFIPVPQNSPAFNFPNWSNVGQLSHPSDQSKLCGTGHPMWRCWIFRSAFADSTSRSSQGLGVQLARSRSNAHPDLGVVLFSAYESRQ